MPLMETLEAFDHRRRTLTVAMAIATARIWPATTASRPLTPDRRALSVNPEFA